MLISVIIGFLICLANALAAAMLIIRAYRGPEEKIIRKVLGGMVVRYFCVTILLWFCLTFLELHRLAFALTFLVSTFVLIILEILYFNYRSNFFNLHNRLTK